MGIGVILAIQNGVYDFKTRAAQQILAKGIHQPFFSNLRTKQQTGYIVSNWTQVLEDQLFSMFAVQSNTHNARDLLARFELLIESFLQEFEKKELKDERFETIKAALVDTMQQPPKNIGELTMILQELAFEHALGKTSRIDRH